MVKLSEILGWVALSVAGVVGLQVSPAIAQARLTFASGSDLYTLPVNGGERISLENEAAVGDVAYQVLNWSPDGTALAVVQNYDTVVLMMPAEGTATPLFKSDCDRPPSLSLSWTAMGRRLIIHERCEIPLSSPPISRAIYTYDLAAGRSLQALAALPEAIDSDIYVSPDGMYVAYVKGQHIYRLAIDAGRPQQLTSVPGDYGLAGSPLAWSPDGQSLAFYEGRYPYQRLNVIGASGQNRRSLTPADQQIYRSRAIWSPDSRFIAFYLPNNAPYSNQEVIQLVEVATGETTVVTNPGFYEAIAWAPDSQQLFFASGDRFSAQYLYLWDRLDQTFTQLNQTPLAQVDSPMWTMTGNQLVLTALPPGDELGNRQIYGLNPDRLDVIPLTQGEDYVFPVTFGGPEPTMLPADPETAIIGQ